MRVVGWSSFVAAMVFVATLICAPSAWSQEAPPRDVVASAETSVSTSPLPAQAVVRAYRLGSGDRVRIIVFGDEGTSGEFQVSSEGSIALPLLGSVKATSLTSAELETQIATRLREEGYFRDPRVAVEVINYRPFFILGEVNRPGEYPYTAMLTVTNAVARAEGFSYRADKRRVLIRRAGETEFRTYSLRNDVEIGPGDTIRVPERFF